MDSIETLKKEIIQRSPDKFSTDILNAIKYAQEKHTDEQRISGEPFVNHSLRTALTVSEMGLDAQSIICAILHSLVGKQELYSEISQIFGEEALSMVKHVKMLEDPAKNTETKEEIITRYLLHISKDLRPILVKLASSLDNIQTVKYLPEEKQKNSLRKVLNIYAPIAEYLNLGDIKRRLEESAFMIYKPEEYNSLKKEYENNRIDEKLREKYLSLLNEKTSSFKPLIYGRIKSLYSVYNKLKKYEKEWKAPNIKSIKDLIAFRIVCKNEEDCFMSLEKIMDSGEINEKEFEDYISNPKPNGYRAIHTIVRFPQISEQEVEIQIVTDEMNYINTYGSASHVAYKASKSRFALPTDEYGWVEDINNSIEENKLKKETEKSIPIKCSLFEESVFVFTPKGKIIPLSKGDTVLDFAFKIHSQVGNSAVGARVNGKAASLNQTLITGDVVEIKSQKDKKYQDISMVKFANSQTVKNKIQKTVLKYR